MKTRLNLSALLLATASCLALMNCSSEKKDDTATEVKEEHASGSTASQEASKPQFEVDAAFQKQLGSVFTAYVELKDALVASDATEATEQAKDVNDELAKVDMKLLTGAAHNDWMTYLSPLQTAVKEIQESTDLEKQRVAFSSLSDNLYKSVKAFGLGGQEAFYEFCPMAFNNEGAYWLSSEQQIKNPYFGDKMLTCGVVKEKLN
jgi:hypothetical protein